MLRYNTSKIVLLSDLTPPICKQSFHIMDPEYNLQDVIRCELCEAPVPPLCCAICHINLCTTCAGEHLLDEYKYHIVQPIKHRQSNSKCSIIPKCQIHFNKLSEFHCEQCDIAVYDECERSDKHINHAFLNISSYLEIKNKTLQADIEELEKHIYPAYQEIASSFLSQRAELLRNNEKLISAINKQGEVWHRKIDSIIRKLTSDIKETESEHLAFLKEQEDDINHNMSEITQSIVELKKLLVSNDGCRFSEYISRNSEFRIFPPKLISSLPSFSSKEIDTEQLIQQFGSLSALSTTTEERLYGEVSLETIVPDIKAKCTHFRVEEK